MTISWCALQNRYVFMRQGRIFTGNQKFQGNIYLKPEKITWRQVVSHCELHDVTLWFIWNSFRFLVSRNITKRKSADRFCIDILYVEPRFGKICTVWSLKIPIGHVNVQVAFFWFSNIIEGACSWIKRPIRFWLSTIKASLGISNT